ncbi:hypothetical protein D0962_28430 [Leptolyngbyaceae cyanobacterium CCMR0082]|uniref:Uncharacterized protein n=1 Tax=Adonisia turfae CCMR0082 TaxID=2304604 RepID=A0A6M0SDS3_9CYAN|nr:hypothetical protein [Adonisia turfae]NEZ66640.1 hypothetical protein [Adonisia turfae CCMR0082]
MTTATPNQISFQHLEELVVEALQRLIRLQQQHPQLLGHLVNYLLSSTTTHPDVLLRRQDALCYLKTTT